MKKKKDSNKKNKVKIDLDLDAPHYKRLNSDAILAIREAQLMKLPALESLEAFQKQFEAINRIPHDVIQEFFKPLEVLRDSYIVPMQMIGEAIQKSIKESGIMQIMNSLEKLQVDVFAGVRISSEFQESITRAANGIERTSVVRETKLLKAGEISLNVQRDTRSNISTEVSFRKLEIMDARLLIIDETVNDTKEEVAQVKKTLERYDSLLSLLEENPFPFFKITKIDFTKSQSYFTINEQIKVVIPSKTIQDYICQVLFSGQKESLTDEWYIDELKHGLKIFIGHDEAENLNWKKIKEAISNINEKIAMETTKKDVIVIPRNEIIQLNSEYFTI
jgi:hypothetical protein